MNFKCQCVSSFKKKIATSSLMSGEFYHRRSIDNLFYPYGLHRTVYKIRFNDKKEINRIKVTFRNRNWVIIKLKCDNELNYQSYNS